ncbi:MAG: tail fiber protein [Pseudomonadota bacterium]
MPYVGEIRIFAGNFPPAGWEFCQGQALPISENETLFQLIGTTYGGDGEYSFNLPDLTSRVPVHSGNSTGPGLSQRMLGESGGVEEVTLSMNQVPLHTHGVMASRNPASSSATAANGVPASVAATSIYGPMGTPGAMTANAIGSAGGSQPHTNMAPYLGVNFIISLYGIFPSQT